MKNKGLFSSLFIEDLKRHIALDDAAQGRMATLAQTWQARNVQDTESLWTSFLKQSLGYLEFVPSARPAAPGVYPLFEDFSFSAYISVLYLVPPGSDISDTSVGRYYPAKLLAHLKERKLNWGILTDGSLWRLYATQSARPYEEYVELSLAETLEGSDEAEYGLFERFFHRDSFIADLSAETSIKAEDAEDAEETVPKKSAGTAKCRLDHDRDQSEKVLEERVKKPFLAQVDEVLQYICNGFIVDTRKSGEEYTEEERAEIFESAVKLIYRCLFLFYAEARRLLPTDPEKMDLYRRHSIQALCREAHHFQWGKRRDTDQYDLWKHLKGLISAVNDGDPEYGIMGYNGGLFDDEKERFLGRHQLRNDFISRALYLLAFVEPFDNEPDDEYPIPYEDLEVRHLGELYENILEYTVQLADADRIRRRTKKGVEILLASQTTNKPGDTLIKKGEVYFGESALERKQTGSYYTPESLVRFLNQKTIVQPLGEIFEQKYRPRFNDLLEQAHQGHDTGTRRGAAQSAASLVERFAAEAVFHFKVCDPAMGSGHFLVDATNQITGLVIALLAEVPHVEGMTVSVSSAPNDWRRRITRHCIYGVDLNPLAVNLAKLSLWLNCFATHHRLTFLDHHVRCGNSLIGIRSLNQLATIPERKKDSKKKKGQQQRLLFDYSDLSGVLAKAAKGVASITRIDEDDTDTQKAVLDEALETTSGLRPLADLYTAYLMDPNIPTGDYKDIIERLAKGKSIAGTLNPTLPETLASVEGYRNWHHFYHWPLEFPDVFGPDAVGGFSATVGNPPWDLSSANPQEFFSIYDPKFRSLNRKQSLISLKKICDQNESIDKKWNLYQRGIAEQNIYFSEPAAYTDAPSGRNNLYQYFLLRGFDLLFTAGRIGIVVPSGIYTDKGCQPLRELFFNQSQIRFLYCFENRWPTVFSAVDGRFKFVTFSTQKGGTTDRFKCAFMEHDPERLPTIDDHAMKMNVALIKELAPQELSIPEINEQRGSDILVYLHKGRPNLGSNQNHSWNANIRIEFMSNTDAWRFKGYGKELVPVYTGATFFQYDPDFSSPYGYVSVEHLQDIYGLSTQPWNTYRVVYRDVAASTNERTCISTVIPPPNACVEMSRIVMFSNINEEWGFALMSLFVGVVNSFVLDFILRHIVTSHLSNNIMHRLPIARLAPSSYLGASIYSRVARLLCTDERFGEFWSPQFSVKWGTTDFWYPTSAPIDAYGPVHEQEIRHRLRDEAQALTSQWGPHCGVHDRLPDRRDTGDRAQLRAEIDAYVAHLYGLSRDDFAYILDTFPVLKKKEKKAFGEFMSKRKCLEEYERIGKVLNGGHE